MANHSTDTDFGPQYGSWQDFTLPFEQSIMGILPTGLFITAAPLYLYVCARKPIQYRPGTILWIKLAAAVCLLAAELASAILHGKTAPLRTDTALAAASLSCIASITVVAILFVEHRRALRPTSLFSLYIFLIMLLDVVKSRSYFMREGLYEHAAHLGGLAAAAGASKLIIIIAQEVPRNNLLVDEAMRGTVGKEATRGFWSRSLFAWLNATFAAGFRRTLTLEDLEPLSPELSSQLLLGRFTAAWEKADKRDARLIRACLGTLAWPFAAVLLPRLIYSAFSFSQPYLLRRILVSVEKEEWDRYERIGLVAATGVLFVGRTLTKAAYMHANFRLSAMIRGTLVSAMSAKQLRLKQSEAKESAIGAVMTADVEGVESGVRNIHDLWTYVLDIGLGFFFLSRFIGLASLTIFGPVIFSTLYGLWVGSFGGKARGEWNKGVQLRVSKMGPILAQTIPIRMMGLGPLVSRFAQGLRAAELELSKKYRQATTATVFGVVFIDSITPVVVIASAVLWTKFKGGFTALEVFPILSLVVIVQGPLFSIVSVLSDVSPTLTCIKRVEEYLELPEWNDSRQFASDEESNSQPGEKGAEKDAGSAIELEEACIAPTHSSQVALSNISLKLQKSHVIPVIGPVGSGKSSFLRALIGEAALKSGQIRIFGAKKIAYCAQVPFLSNTTVRQNIVGSDDFDEKLYTDVLQACQLVDDLNELPIGDMTIVGSDGMNLSVGQQVRVSLARAAFTAADVVIIDDVFGSLDKKTTRAILKSLLGKDGLLRKRQSTVIFATHLGDAIDVADQVLLLDGLQGIKPYEKKDFESATFKSTLREAINSPDEQCTAPTLETIAPSPAAPTIDLDDGAARDLRVRNETGIYRFYFRSFPKSRIALFILLMLGLAFFDNFPNGYIRLWVDKAPGNKLLLIGYCMFALVNAAVGLAGQRLFYLQLLPHSGGNLHQMLLAATMGATYAFICTVDSGSLLNRFSQDMNSIVQDLPTALYKFIFMALSSCIEMGFVFAGASYASLAMPFVGGALYFIQMYYLRTSRQLRHLELEAKAPLFVYFKETTNGIEHIRSFGRTSSQLEQGLQLLDASQRAFYQLCCVQRWLLVVLDLTVAATAVVITAIALYVRNSSSAPSIGLSFLVLIEFGDTLSRTVNFWTNMEISLGSISRIKAFVDSTPQEKDTASPAAISEHWPEHGRIDFTNVTSRYTTEAVLKDATFTLNAGEKVAIQGRSGSGKSTLLLTTLNFLEYDGAVTIDGVNIRSVPRQTLRERITTIPQLPVVLAGSIRDNLTPFTDDPNAFSPADLEYTLDKLGIWTVVRAKGGLDAPMDSAGFSVAEQQLVCIARALLHHKHTRSKVVIIDEATATLSVAAAKHVQRATGEAFKECTVLAVSHWDAAMQKADVNLDVDKGVVTCTRTAEEEA